MTPNDRLTESLYEILWLMLWAMLVDPTTAGMVLGISFIVGLNLVFCFL